MEIKVSRHDDYKPRVVVDVSDKLASDLRNNLSHGLRNQIYIKVFYMLLEAVLRDGPGAVHLILAGKYEFREKKKE